MIAGGTGITPMLQIVRAALKNPLDQTKLSLIYANVNVEDILLRTELDELATRHPDRFRIYYVLNNPPPNWNGGVGFVTKEQIQENLPPSYDDIKILLCGKSIGCLYCSILTTFRPATNDDRYEVRSTASGCFSFCLC